MKYRLYVAVDGDDVGHRLEYLMLLNKIQALTTYSQQFNRAMDWLEGRFVKDLDATILFMGGDNLLAGLPRMCSYDTLEALRTEFAKHADSTTSFGLGKTPREAYFALKLAKAAGKDRIQYYKDFADE